MAGAIVECRIQNGHIRRGGLKSLQGGRAVRERARHLMARILQLILKVDGNESLVFQDKDKRSAVEVLSHLISLRPAVLNLT
jgi:hypothetical protein